MLYLRYSSSNQTEQSIEGQRRVCEDYAKREGITVIREYVDRATSASHDTQKRLSFQRMIKDAKSRTFDLVLVYKLDRFSRDRYDFANYRAKLKDCGVRIQSATEAISDSPESVIMESLLEGMAEYYSRELSQKVLRGMNESAQKRQVLGGVIPLGLMIKDKHYVPDPATRGIVEGIFSDYAGGMSLKEIADDLNRRGIRNVSGKKFGPQSVWRILKNEKYVGIYRHKDICDPDAIEPIVSPELWKQVQEKRKMSEKIRRKRPKTPAAEFLLKARFSVVTAAMQWFQTREQARRGKFTTTTNATERNACLTVISATSARSCSNLWLLTTRRRCSQMSTLRKSRIS